MENIQQWLAEIGIESETLLWGMHIFIIVLATAFISMAGERLLNKLAQKTEHSTNLWDDAFLQAAQRPLRVMIWIVGISMAANIAFSGIISNESSEQSLRDILSAGRSVAVVFCITWFCLRFIRFVERNIFAGDTAQNIKLDRTTASAISKLLRITVIITAFLIGMQTLGFSIGGLLAFGGIGGMAVALAAKDMLANFFGAIMIYLDRPFSVGDWVRSPDKSIEGTVEEIGWRQTRIRTFDKRPLYIPNSVFSTIIVENPSRMTNRRIYETIGVRYDDMEQVQNITRDVKAMLKKHKEIDTQQTLIVNLNAFSASSVDFFIYTFTKTTDWIKFHEIKQDVLLKVADIVGKHNAEIAYPTQTLHIAHNMLDPESMLPPVELEDQITH